MTDDAGTILPNPLDLSAPAFDQGVFRDAFKIVDDYDGIDFLISHVPFGIMHMPSFSPEKDVVPSFAEEVVKAHKALAKPLAAVIHAPTSAEDWQVIFEFQRKCYEEGLPVYQSIGNAAKAIDRFMTYHERRAGN